MVLTRRKLLSMLFSVGAISQIPKLKTESLFTTSPPKGIDFVLRNSPTSRKYLVETMPGGAALLDYNNDGLPGIFLINAGARLRPAAEARAFRSEQFFLLESAIAPEPRWYIFGCHGAGGLQNAGDTNYKMGVAVGDYDNDGFPDIYVTNFGRNILYHNNGDGTFTDVTAKAGVGAGGWSASPAFLTTTTMGISTCS